jgi:hypothetical protein
MNDSITPVSSAAEGEPASSRWPTVWGVLMLIWAGLTALGACCASFGVFVAPMFAGMAGMKDFPKAPPILSVWIIGDGVVSIVLVVVLVMAGMALIRRRANARSLVMAYVVIRILVALPNLVMGIASERPMAEWQRQMSQAQVEFIQSRGGEVPPQLVEASHQTEPSRWARWQTLGTTLLGVVFPAVAGIWFSRRSVRDEIAGWSGAPSA